MPADMKKFMDRVSGEISKVVMGQQEAVNLLLVGLLARGHVLMEGVPGLGKTLLAKTLAHVLRAEFTRSSVHAGSDAGGHCRNSCL